MYKNYEDRCDARSMCNSNVLTNNSAGIQLLGYIVVELRYKKTRPTNKFFFIHEILYLNKIKSNSHVINYVN